MFPNVTPISVLVPHEDVKSRETPTHTLKNRANKCKTCWGYGTISIRRSTKKPIWFQFYSESGQKIYSTNPEVVKCSCQH